MILLGNVVINGGKIRKESNYERKKIINMILNNGRIVSGTYLIT